MPLARLPLRASLRVRPRQAGKAARAARADYPRKVSLAARAQAEAVRAARRLRRLRSEEDRIFFDKRDEVLHYCTDTLDDLQVLQSALAGVAPPPAPSLSGIRNWRDAERHLIARLESAAESARRIP